MNMSGQTPFHPSGQYNYSRDVRYGPNATVESSMPLSRRPSMLASYHNQYGATERTSMPPYYLPIPAVSMGAHVDENVKRAHYASLNAQFLPLGIDVKKEQPLYQPATEAISPINDETKFDTHLRDTTIIRNTISKLESEIGMTQEKLHRAKISRKEIRRQAADRTAVDDDEEIENTIQINGSQTLIEKILHENRKTAEDGQKILNQLNNQMDLVVPLYQEPNDLDSIGEIRRKYMSIMKNRLVNLFKKSRERYMLRTKFACEKYDEVYRNWQKSIEKEEKTIIGKDSSTYRETFDKTFPELRKAREDKEKKQTSDASTNVADGSTTTNSSNTTNSVEQENEEDDEKMRKLSVVPPILYDTWQRKHQYFNQNGLIKGDVALFYKDHAKVPFWSPEEKQIFIEKFTQSPKNFGYISLFLENKTTEECVQFYYMTKKTENYKSLLRKQNQPLRRRARQNPTATMTTTTVTSSTTIETTLVTKVTSSNTIVSSTSQQILGSTNGQENDRGENDDDRRDLIDNNEEKRANKSRCQFLSCTTGKKKTRKNRLRGFPRQWNELTDEHREEIRRSLKIPTNVQRCCKCCYEKLIPEIRQRQDNQVEEDDDDEDEEEENNDEPTNISNRSTLKRDDDEWTAADIDAFTQAVEKYNYNWREIAEYLQRSEKSCRTFYQNQQKVIVPDDNLDDDNRSLSDSEVSTRKTLQVDETVKQNLNDDSNDSPHPMVIDEREETRSMIEENPIKPPRLASNPSGSNLTTINSLVEQEISKTLNQTEKHLNNSSMSSTDKVEHIAHPVVSSAPSTIPSVVPPPPPPPPTTTTTTTKISTPQPAAPPPPPPLVIPVRTHSPPASHYAYSSYSQGTPVSAATKGSIMRGTPISASAGMNKTMPIEAPSANLHPHPYHTSRNEPNPMKSPKILDRNLEQQQQQMFQQQQHHNAYLRQYSQAGPSAYLSQQQQQQQQQQQSAAHKSSSSKLDPSNPNTYETLRADFFTSKYLNSSAASHSSSHERSHRGGAPTSSDHRMSRQASPPINPALLPPPAAIVSSGSNPSVSSSAHPHHAQTASNFLPTSQMLAASSGMYAQELLTSGLLPYAPYYGSLPPGAQFLFDPRTMRDYAVATANSEQMKIEQQKSAMRASRHHHPHHPSAHSPPDSSPAYPPAHPGKRHFHDEMGYPNAEYGSSVWRTPAGSHSAFSKTNPGTNENPLSKLNEMSRQSSSRMTSGNERNSRSPDEQLHPHHRMNPSRSAVESPSLHFQRVEAQNHPKMSQDPSNAHLHYLDHPNDANSLNYMRQTTHIPKPQPTHPSPHRLHQTNNPSGRPIIPSSPHPPQHHASPYLMHGFPHGTMGTLSPQRQHHHPSHGQSHAPTSSHHPSSQQHYPGQHRGPSAANQKESIQDFMAKAANEFIRSTNHPYKHSTSDSSSYESSANQISSRHPQASNSDQPILIDGNDDPSPHEQNEIDSNMRTAHKSHIEGEMMGRRRDSSIKKILSNQSLEKQEYDEINQKVQNNPNNNSKLPSNNDPAGIERSNSIGGRTRSRGSITMRMLMGDNEPYVDGKAQRRPSQDEPSNKRALSPSIHNEKIGYLIRDALYRTHPTIPKDNDAPSVFQKSSAAHQQQTPSKRMRPSGRDDDPRQSSTRSPVDSNATLRDPFALQPHSKSAHSSPFAPSSNADRPWQTHAQQQFHHSSSSPAFSNRSSSSRPPNSIPTSMRLPNEQGPYGSASNNQLINPRYPYYMNKNEQQQFQLSRQSSTSPHDPSIPSRHPRRPYQAVSPPNEPQTNSTLPVNFDQSPTAKSPSINPMMMTNPMAGNTPPTTASPTANTGHSLKKRLITEYSLEQHRNSPVAPSPTLSASTKSDAPEETNETHSTNDTENVSTKTEIPPETVHESTDDLGHST